MIPPESIILAFVNTSKEYLNHLSFELREIRDNALRNAEEGNHIQIIEHHGATYRTLSNLLHSDKANNVTMLHYSGHSNGEGLWVEMDDRSGTIKTKQLSTLFLAHKKFRFVFLNSCYSENIAKELTEAGIPYVVGTTNSIDDKEASIVAGQFYKFLARQGKTIKEAFDLTRDYLNDPLYNGGAAMREAPRSLSLTDVTRPKYPWHLYESSTLRDEDRKWSMVPEPWSSANSSHSSEKKYQLSNIRKFLEMALDDTGLNIICMDHFESVYNKFADGQNKSQKINMLLDFCRRNFKFDTLLGIMQKSDTVQFERYKPYV